jgi:hypothetical protein
LSIARASPSSPPCYSYFMPQERRSFYKSESEIGTLCPVCGWDFQADKSDQICPCCGFQFNYGDSYVRTLFDLSWV